MNRYELDETQNVWRESDPVPPHQDRSPLEQWIWAQLRIGKIANLDH